MAAESAVRIIFTGNASGAVRSIRSLETSFSSLGRSARIAAGALAVGFGVALGAAAKSALDFDRAMRNVQSLTKQSEKSFQSLSRQVLALAGPTGQAPKTLAEGLYDVVSSGFAANDAITVLAASAKAATAGMTDTATATKAVVAILNAYHLSADKAREVSDVLFQEVNLGVNTFADLAQNIGDTAPAAAALGIPFSEVSAALATITRQGNDMSLASTQVARVLISLIKPTKGMTAELHHMGFESGQAAIKSIGFSQVVQRLSKDAKGNQQTLIDWTGDIRGFRGIVGLTGQNLSTYTKLVRQMGDATKGVGATQAAFAEQAKSISFQWQQAKASLTAAAIPIGQLLFPALVKGAQGVTYLANAIQQHMPQIKRITNETVRAIADGWQRYATPAIQFAQRAAVAIAQQVQAHWPQIRSTAQALGNSIRSIFGSIKSVIHSLLPILQALGPEFKAAFAIALVALRVFAATTALYMRGAAAAIGIVAPVAAAMVTGLNKAASAGVSAAKSFASGVVSAFHGVVSAIQTVIHWVQTLIHWLKSIPHDISVHIHIPQPHLPHIPGGSGLDLFKKVLAGGGFVPGSEGDAVPILAHAGEVVLNKSQQAAMGGVSVFKRMFGFTGGEGPAFAAGGIVTKRPNRKHSGRTRHSKRPPRYKPAGKKARAALSAVDAVNQKEDDLDRAYGQLVRQYDISPEQYIVTNDAGVDVVNQSGMTVGGKFIRGIDQRVAEIDSLLGSRQSMLDLIDQEKAQLKKAIKKLQAAVKALLAAIRAEHGAIRDLNHQISAERKKKKPNQAKIGRWQNAISGHNTTIGNMTSTLSEFRGAIKDSNQNLLHVLPFDRRDVELDMASLSFERGDISGTTLPPGQGGGGVAQIPPNLAGLAQAIGSLQGSILGQFQMGSLHVPETGLYRLHAGETVTPAGVKRGGDGGSISDVKVRVELAGDLQGLENFIRVTAVKATPEIGAELGRRGDERLRGGRY